MKKLSFTKKALVTGENSLEYLSKVKYSKIVVVTGGQSMTKTGVIDKIKTIMKADDSNFSVFSGIKKNPTTAQVLEGTEFLLKEKPDVIIAAGGGSSIDAAKIMMLFYEHPEINFDNVFSVNLDELEINSTFIAIPSTSGTASEVTHVSVITSEKDEFKFAIKTENIRPDIAILDGSIPMTMPASIAAETGMDALTHAIEAYTNKSGDSFTDALAKEAIEGIIEWLPRSVEKGDLESRSKMHDYQCMAGMAFSNSGLGMVHGIAHAFGGKYNMAHGLANAIILPYAMRYNKRDPETAAKFEKLSKAIGGDIIETVDAVRAKIGIPAAIGETGITKQQFEADFEQLLGNSMKGATVVNPVSVSKEDMAKILECVFYGKEIDF